MAADKYSAKPTMTNKRCACGKRVLGLTKESIGMEQKAETTRDTKRGRCANDALNNQWQLKQTLPIYSRQNNGDGRERVSRDWLTRNQTVNPEFYATGLQPRRVVQGYRF